MFTVCCCFKCFPLVGSKGLKAVSQNSVLIQSSACFHAQLLFHLFSMFYLQYLGRSNWQLTIYQLYSLNCWNTNYLSSIVIGGMVFLSVTHTHLVRALETDTKGCAACVTSLTQTALPAHQTTIAVWWHTHTGKRANTRWRCWHRHTTDNGVPSSFPLTPWRLQASHTHTPRQHRHSPHK